MQEELHSKGADIAYNVAKELKNTSLNFEFHWCLPAGKYKNILKVTGVLFFMGRYLESLFTNIGEFRLYFDSDTNGYRSASFGRGISTRGDSFV